MKKTTYLENLFLRYPNNKEIYNYDLLPEEFCTTEYVTIFCKTHGIFIQKATSHFLGQGCKVCGLQKRANSRANTTEEYIHKSKSKFSDSFEYIKTIYKRQDINLTITCKVHGDFEINPRQHLLCKYGCPKCAYEIPRKKRIESLLQKAKEYHGDTFIYQNIPLEVRLEYKTEIICPTHGSFWQNLYQHAILGTSCPKCMKDKEKSSTKEFIEKSQKIHGDKYDYSKVSYEICDSKVIIICHKHGEFEQRASSHLSGNGCKKCFQEENKISKEEFIKNAKKIHGETYNYDKVNYLGNKTLVEIICPTHGSFWQKPNSHVSSRNGCRFCYESKGEKAVEIFLKNAGINFIREYRILPHLYRYDFYLPDFNIFIEFHGKQHYQPIELFGGDEEFEKVKERDKIKKTLVEKINGKLLVFTYFDLKENSLDNKIISKLKKVYPYWFKVNGKTIALQNIMDVYNYFGIDGNVLVRNISVEISKVVKNFEILFHCI